MSTKEACLRAKKKSYSKRMDDAVKALGMEQRQCYICKATNKDRQNIVFHEKYGNGHTSQVAPVVIRNPENFVMVCRKCHLGIHWCMKHLNMRWADINEYIEIKEKANRIP